MEQGRGSSIPWEKGVAQNGNVWIPSTPDKPFLQSSSSAQSQVQHNPVGRGNWLNLIDMYEDVLRNKQPHSFDLNRSEGPSYSEHIHEGVLPAENCSTLQQNLPPDGIFRQNSDAQNSRDVAPVEAYSTGVSNLELNRQNVGILQKLRSLNHNANAGRNGYYLQNLGEVVSPQEVSSFADLMSIVNAKRSPPSTGSSNRSSLSEAMPTVTRPVSQVESNHPSVGVRAQQDPIFDGSNHLGYASVGVRAQQDHIFDGSNHLGYASVGVRAQQDHIFTGSNQVGYTSVGVRSQQDHVFHGSNHVDYAPVGARAPQNHILHGSHHVDYASVGARAPQNHILHGSNHVDYTSVVARSPQNHVLHGNNQAYAAVGAGFPQSHVFYGNHGGYVQLEIPNSRPSVPQFAINFTPRSEARELPSASRSLLLRPVTPDQQNQVKTHGAIQVPQLLIENTSTPEKYVHDSAVLSPEAETLEKDHGDILDKSMGASTAETLPQEMRSVDGGIDLNKTPQQKTPKRKHRPKVIKEGKPKRSPKPASTKSNTPDGNTPAKRKYVRRTDAEKSTPPVTDTVKVAEASDTRPATKSSKRRLNFDMETVAVNRTEKEGQGTRHDHQEQNNELHKLRINSSGPSASAANVGRHNPYDEEIQQTSTACKFVSSIDKIPSQESTPLESAALPPTSRDRSLNIIARSFSMRNASLLQPNDESRFSQVHHHSSGGRAHLVFQGNPCEQNFGFGVQSSVQTTPQVLEDLVDLTDKHRAKRPYEPTLIGSPQNVAFMGSHLQPHGIPEWQSGSETCSKKNTVDKLNGTSLSMHSGFTTVEELVQQIASRRNKSYLAQTSESQNVESRHSDCRRQMINLNPNDHSTNVICDQYMNHPNIRHTFQQHRALSQVHLCSERMLPQTSHNLAGTQITKSVTAVINRKESASIRDHQQTPINGNISSPLHAVVNKQSVEPTTYQKEPVVDKFLQREPEHKKNYGNSSKKVRGNILDRVSTVDDIINGMKHLHITSSGKEIVLIEQSALVPYKGDGAVVPYDLVKKRKPRPRVDLDPETNRLWNLLMGKEGGESAEPMDTNKEKWWEEERKVFRGRVDSFIARMHLVQGDRRFSKWKGSVVDSVIGVFLTQNVSDHLSSSAFMCLAAKFPLKSTAAREPFCENGKSPARGNHEVRITYPDGTTFHQKMAMEPVSGQSQVTSTKTDTYRTDHIMPEDKTFLVNDHYTRRTDEDIISSQSSSESFVIQASEDVRSSSGSNSDAECGWKISKSVGHQSGPQQAERIAELQPNKSQPQENLYINKMYSIDHQQFEKPADRQSSEWAGISKVQHHQRSVLPDSWTNMLMGIGNWEVEDLAFLGRESISTLTSKDSKGTDARSTDDYRGQSAESAFMASKDERSDFQTPSMKRAIPEKGLEFQNDSLEGSYNRHFEHSIKHMSEKQGAFHREGTVSIDPRRPSEAFSKQPSDNRKSAEVETDMGQGQSSEKLSSTMGNTTPNARKQKAEKEKAEPFNWDTLRKQVLSKAGTTTGRSKEAMDSLDYEAMLNADVREISDAIKERGMNNMLAERMKNFLKRLVDDHERIDLEWLRDVDPDKAKDYLLSIRGLGLKSVECIRLLTLHHLAFPVDTNVGRIAVRLGWVPLQPLPESLQLHLLELYPVLESIQKYLWPRLCKLDQETLYELHYQMITFGKVFCTKRDPNCNACPLRGECRHFASAFASARLSLPGPQEKHIVCSSTPKSATNHSDVMIKPMPLPSSEDIMDHGLRSSRDCEPLIEEPTTPEPPIEVEERDIEDAFYDDTEEIPVIKLNIDEFTTNLQSFIQEQIEIGEGDMSKALVALNPAFASLPTPKLKHVSRLRTEHRVYELPDSHILLKGMDRREPDDPSPYLLAIWTPGETADSVQPPEGKCSSVGGCGLCNNEACFSCNSTREAQSQTVRGTILIPCRTAMRGSFPLNGTYFQVNEVFADHESSLNPIDVPRSLIWNLPKRTVFFGTSVTSIFKGLSTEDIQFCFWKGLVCVRGFDQKNRAPRPLRARLHFPASRMATKRNEEK